MNCRICKTELTDIKFKSCQTCRDRNRQAVIKYRETNPEKVAESRIKTNESDNRKNYNKHYYERNKNIYLRRCRNWATLNKDKRAGYYKKWVTANPDKRSELHSHRRATKARATVIWANRKAIREIFTKAVLLTEDTGIEYQVDHIVPLQSKVVCGLHCEQNLQILTRIDNIKKGNRSWPDMW